MTNWADWIIIKKTTVINKEVKELSHSFECDAILKLKLAIY